MPRLAVDIGNTETAVGVYESDAEGPSPIERTIRIPSDNRVTPDLLYSLLQPHIARHRFDVVVICSVVPHLTAAWTELAGGLLESHALVIDPLSIPDIEIRIEQPLDAGVDRIVNAWMGYRRYGGPLVIVDMGTATTFDIVDQDGSYLGGVIAPGVNLFAESLSLRTAKLPRIELTAPSRVIGKNTVDALKSGVVLGHASMVEGLLDRIAAEIGPRRAVATGGLMESVRPFLESRFHAFDRNLTLDGIVAISKLIWNRIFPHDYYQARVP